MEQTLKIFLQEINKCYLLADQGLLERERLNDLESKIRTELKIITGDLDDEILCLKFKKLNSGWRSELKPGFHSTQTAHSTLEVWRIFINEIVEHIKKSTKTFKNRLEAEGLFIESRSKEGGDVHLLIGERDGNSDKAHVVVDEKTGEIRVEDNQIEPLELVKKIESVVTLPSGKRIRVTRESLGEIDNSDESVGFSVKDVNCGVTVMLKEGVADTFMVTVSFILKNFFTEKVHIQNIICNLLVPDGYETPSRFGFSLTKSEIDINSRDIYSGVVQFSTSIKGQTIGLPPGDEWNKNKQKILSSVSLAKVGLEFSADYISVSGEGKIREFVSLTDKVAPLIFK